MFPARTAGIALCALLALLDIVGLSGFFMHPTPPAAAMISGAVLGVVTFAGVWMARQDRRGAIATVVASRVVSALLGIPVFFADDAPRWAQVVVAIAMALTVVGVALLASPSARRQPAAP